MRMISRNFKWCTVVLSLSLCTAFRSYAGDIVVTAGRWKVSYIEADKAFRVNVLHADGTARKCLFNRSASEAAYDNAGGTARSVTTASFAKVELTQDGVDDEFGAGICYTFAFSQPDNGDDVRMEQRFYVYEGRDYMITSLTLRGDASIRSNYLAPVSVNRDYTLFTGSGDNRMLSVPFDNDGFCRYHKYGMNREMTSYEVSAFYNGTSREGMILGSVEHNRWKSAVKVKASDNGKINMLRLYSGASEPQTGGSEMGTRDVLPHGKVDGPEITSARMLVDYADDWRQGMDEFARANTLVAPMRNTWTKGTPFGWQSWGVLADKKIAQYYHEVLKPGGFHNGQGVQVISIDSWDNLSDQQKKQLCALAEENGQVVGTYCSPFALWWNTVDDLKNNNLEGTSYKGIDCVLKVNGEPYKLDGAFCLDPTHPGVKSNISYQLRRMKAQGFKYVKVDFTSNGMVQADSYYASKVKTAVEAYNNGFSYFCRVADEGEPLFIALSIAPVFPYQYGNSRRIACDTWGRIDQTEYSMNAISGGWWTDKFYQYNDPDHLVLKGNGLDGYLTTEGENRARFTNGAVSGMVLVGDNFALGDNSGKGWPELSRQSAEKIMMNRDMNEMADLGRSFMPVYGYKEYNGNDAGAETCFMHHTADYLYVAVFNYTASALSGDIPLADLDIEQGDFDEVKELWSGSMVNVQGKLTYNVPNRDVKVFRFHKKSVGINDAVSGEHGTDRLKVARLAADGRQTVFDVASSAVLTKVEVFDMQGRLLKAVPATGYSVRLSVASANSLLLLRAMTADGQILTTKMKGF